MHIVSRTDLSAAPAFDSWYKSYPHKIARAAAEKAWAKLSTNDQQAAIQALPRHIAYWQAGLPFDGYTPPHPATWLNGRRWEDELPMTGVSYCTWPGCKAAMAWAGLGAKYCSRHQAALARGETPTR